MEHVRTAALIVSTLTMGLAAGVFGIYANAIMPGLRGTDDRTSSAPSSRSTRRSSTRCS